MTLVSGAGSTKSQPSQFSSNEIRWRLVNEPELHEKPVHLPALGLIELAMEVAMSSEIRCFFDGTSAGIYTTRVPFSGVANPSELGSMERRVQAAAALLPNESWMSVIAYGCTSGSAVIGHKRLVELIREVRPGLPIVTPISAVSAAIRSLGAEKIAAVTPYTMEVNRIIEGTLAEDGVEIISACTFGIEDGFTMMQMPPECFLEAALSADVPEAEAIFISCTGIFVSDVLEKIEAATGKPVVTSNQAIAWQCLEMAGVQAPSLKYGKLFGCRQRQDT
ncbi:maleate cis-trans isomerase family protein [Ruegeria sp. SCP11]|uniref:maleate cis-trans isomerase family protein n=1 Tax=Ruegeria sp. SCP11 TaxID=3141378 RepID=UPI00333BF02C